MRKFILLLSLCVSVCSFAVDRKPVTKEKSSLRTTSIAQPELKFGLQRISTNKMSAEEMYRRFDAKTKAANSIETRADVETYQQLDSVVILNEDGSKYGKSEYDYNDAFQTTRIANFFWNSEDNEWNGNDIVTGEYDANGRLTAKQTYYPSSFSGERTEYKYDERGNQTEVKDLFLSRIWIPTRIVTYVYDNNNNPIEIYSSSRDEETGIFVDEAKSIAEFDAQGNMTMLEAYDWTDGEWIGARKVGYKFDAAGNTIQFDNYEWVAATKTWFYFHKIEQEYNQNNDITLQEQSYWNAERQDWTGAVVRYGDIVLNDKSIHTYDAKGRKTLEKASTLLADGTWVDTYSYEFTYEDQPEGGYKVTRMGYYLATDRTADVEDQKYVQIFDANGLETYAIESTKRGFDGTYEGNYFTEDHRMITLTEDEYTYNSKGDYTYEAHWEYSHNVANIKMAYLKAEIEYDSNFKSVKYTSYNGELFNFGEGGAETWLPGSKFEYKNTVDGFRYESIAYVMMEGETDWTFNFKEYEELDYDTPQSKLIVFDGYNFGYKTIRTLSSDRWGSYYDRYFHYSNTDKEITGINNTPTADQVTVYPNPATDVININATEDVKVSIYNLQGSVVLQSTEKQINIGSLPTGCYIVDVDGIKSKLIKK